MVCGMGKTLGIYPVPGPSVTKISVPVLGGRKKHGNFPKSILKL